MKNKFLSVLLVAVLISIQSGCSSSSEGCSTISCQNAGVFIDCECDCPQGYSGTNCEIQVTPSRITITKVTVRVFPALDENTETWDASIGDDAFPDLYFQFVKSPSDIIYDSPTFYENANVINNYEFVIDTPIQITDMASTYVISLWDYDLAGADDLMAAQSFFIYEDGNDFPTTITVSDSTQPIVIDLEISYQW